MGHYFWIGKHIPRTDARWVGILLGFGAGRASFRARDIPRMRPNSSAKRAGTAHCRADDPAKMDEGDFLLTVIQLTERKLDDLPKVW